MGMRGIGKEEKKNNNKKKKMERSCGGEVRCGSVWEGRNKRWKKIP